MRIFISHSSKDAELAERICKKIEEEHHSCFLAPRDIRFGHEYAEEIIDGIDGADVMLLLLSQAANDSPHVLREIERAVSKKKPVIVYKLEEVTLSKSMEYFLMTHQWLTSSGRDDFSEIIARINEYAAPQQTEQQVAAVQEKSQPAAHGRKILPFAAAAVVVAAGIGTGAFLANRAPSADGEETAEPAAAMVQDLPTEQTSATTPVPEAPAVTESAATAETTTAPESSTAEEAASVPENTQLADTSAPAPQSEAPAVTEAPVTESAEQTTAQPQDNPEPEEAAAVQPGDKLMFGTYNGEPIKWRILRVSEDGKQATAIADSIITMKAYDAAEGGEYNKYDGKDYWTTKPEDIPADIQRLIRGDNRWELSNIRTWLNSDKENVSYSGQAPASKAMAERRNGYHTEAGFLNGFTKAERAALIEAEITTNGEVTSDKVFLLSSDELEWLYEADVSVFAKPTAAAVEQDKSCWYTVDCEAYGVEDFFWWLRDANPENACECYYVNISYTNVRLASGSVGLEGYGIRPAVTFDLTADAVKTALENANETN